MRAFASVTAAVLVAVAIGVALSAPATNAPGAAGSTFPLTVHGRVAAVELPGNLSFSALGAKDGALTLGGSANAGGDEGVLCTTALVDPDTLGIRNVRETGCDDVSAPGAPVAPVSVDQSDEAATKLKIARFDPRTGRVHYGPVVFTYGSYSDTRPVFAYGGGDLWIFDADTTHGAEVVEVSDMTGSVLDTVPFPKNTYRPILAANDDGLWIGISGNGGYTNALGPNAAPIYHVAPGSRAPTLVHTGGVSANWIVASGHAVWVDIAGRFTSSNGARTNVLWRFDGGDARVAFHHVLPVGFSAFLPFTVFGGERDGLWTALVPFSPSVSEFDPPTTQLVYRIDPDTGVARIVARLHSQTLEVYQNGLDTDQGAIADGSFFFIDTSTVSGGASGPSTLYRIAL